MPPTINSFQSDMLKSLCELSTRLGWPSIYDQGGKDESYIRFGLYSYTLYIYSDGLEISGDKTDIRFELPDYDTLDDMARAFMATLEEKIRSKIP